MQKQWICYRRFAQATRDDFGHDKAVLLFEFLCPIDKKIGFRCNDSKLICSNDTETKVKVYID